MLSAVLAAGWMWMTWQVPQPGALEAGQRWMKSHPACTNLAKLAAPEGGGSGGQLLCPAWQWHVRHGRQCSNNARRTGANKGACDGASKTG